MKNNDENTLLLPLCCLIFITLFAKGSYACAFILLPSHALELHDYKTTFQQRVGGTVKDADGIPLPGVNVQLKGKTSGTSTDLNGRYAIEASQNDTLVFSYIGSNTQEVAVNDKKVINVQLSELATALDAVTINAGYYTTTEKERTGSIVQVTSEEIERQPVINPLAALQGRVAGVQVTQTTGVPGGGFDIRIRGQNSLRRGANDPLFIIDGVPYASETLGYNQVSGSVLPGDGFSPLNAINPADIVKISVLKDADATAIYGSRGANGVVLITTKQGKTGKTQLDLNISTGIGEVPRKVDLLNTPQYLALRREAFANDGISPLPANAYDVNGAYDQNRFTDWQDVLLGGKAHIINAQASVSGGSSNTRFLLSTGYQRQTSVFPGDYAYDKGSVHLNVNHSDDQDRFTAAFSAIYTTDKNDQPSTDLTREALSLVPNAPALYDSEDNLNFENSTFSNPLRLLEETYLSKTNTLLANATLAYKVLKNLRLKANLGFTESSVDENRTSPSTVYDPAFGLGSEVSFLIDNTAKQRSYIIEPQAQYEMALGNHKLNFLAGGTFQRQTREQLGQFASGFASNALINNITAASNVSIINSENTVYKYAALFGRINYNFKGKYLVNLTGRRDGSSRFGPGKQFANFGAVGAAWVFSEEAAVQKALPILSYGKLRGSYGSTGSDKIGDYQYLQTYNLTGARYAGVSGLGPTRLFNPDFGWETNRKFEIALEFALLKDRLRINTAYYNNRSSNQLVGLPLPATTGFSSIQANLDATVENVGWEIGIQGDLARSSSLKWTAGLNLTIPDNKLVRFDDLEASTYANQYVIGESLNLVKTYNLLGVDPQTGIYQFQDFNGDGQISFPQDLQTPVTLDPKYFGGLNTALTYTKWEFSFLVQFVKQQGLNFDYQGGLPGAAINQPVGILDRWQQAGNESSIQRLTTGANSQALNAYFNFDRSNGAYTDASFVRLKNISISFTVPKRFIKTFDCRLYVQAQNLLTLTPYEGLDPENQSAGNLPPLRLITTGVQITF